MGFFLYWAGRGVEVVFAGGLLVVVGFGVGALGAVAGRVGDFDKAPAVEHKWLLLLFFLCPVQIPRSRVFSFLLLGPPKNLPQKNKSRWLTAVLREVCCMLIFVVLFSLFGLKGGLKIESTREQQKKKTGPWSILSAHSPDKKCLSSTPTPWGTTTELLCSPHFKLPFTLPVPSTCSVGSLKAAHVAP